MVRLAWKALPAFAALLLVGCRLVQDIADAPGNTVRTIAPAKRGKVLDPVVLQHALMRFADDFAGRILVASESLPPVGEVSLADIQEWRIGTQMNTWSTAAGPNAVGSLFDLVAMVTVMKLNIEEYWVPTVFGDQAKVLLESVRAAETEIWRIASEVLTPGQIESLREEIIACEAAEPGAWKHDLRAPGSVFDGFRRGALQDHQGGFEPSRRPDAGPFFRAGSGGA